MRGDDMCFVKFTIIPKRKRKCPVPSGQCVYYIVGEGDKFSIHTNSLVPFPTETIE